MENNAHILGIGGSEGPLRPPRQPTNSKKRAAQGLLHPSWSVRPSSFFVPGRIIEIVWSETAAETAHLSIGTSRSVTESKYPGHYIFTHIRTFVVVQKKRECCYACPINTYSGLATTKKGVRPKEHGMIYKWDTSPQLLDGESGVGKTAIAYISTDRDLHVASRVHYGVHMLIQYNVKVKDSGYVIPEDIPRLLGNYSDEVKEDWKQTTEIISSRRSSQRPTRSIILTEDTPEKRDVSPVVPSHESPPTSQLKLEFVNNPKGYFKKGKVFMTLWSEPRGFTEAERAAIGSLDPSFGEVARFAVWKPKATHCVCVRISTYSGQATTKHGIAASEHAAVLPVGSTFQPHPDGESQLLKDALFVKVENPEVTIDSASRINFGKLYTVEYNIRIGTIGRIVGESIAKLDEYVAESMGLAKP